LVSRPLPALLLSVLAFAVLVSCDLAARARTAYLEGEKYMAWHAQPSLKRAHYDALLAADKVRLAREKAEGRLSMAELDQRFELLRAERDERVAESSAKYALRWFETAAGLFSPPETPGTRTARARAADARAAWLSELKAAKIPYQAYQVE
jgi:hypothetical protein